MPTRNEVVYTSTGLPIRLGREIGRGGEGIVYEVEGRTEQVAKLYLAPIDSSKTAKLQTMVRQRTDAIAKFAAWPSDLLLKAPKGRVTGLLMKKVSGFRPIHELYTPKSRLQEFPRANWPFLIHTAANVARAFALLHSCRIVIGDVNHGNVLVNDAAICALIDCDSFQVLNNGHRFICEVGVSTYTPPELQGKRLSSIVRTENHDNFGLALLIFHLLFMGRHPFAGRFLGTGEMPVERAIRECRFAFSANCKAVQMAPPPNALRLADLPADMGNLFEQAFSPLAAHGAPRPHATQWIDALDGLSHEIAKCARTSSHHYYKQRSSCPWCAIEKGSALMLFLQLDWASLNSNFSLTTIWAQITSVPAPGPAPPLKGRQDLQKTFAMGMARRRRKKLTLGIGMVVTTIAACLALKLSADMSFWITLTAVCIAFIIGKVTSKPVRRDAKIKDAAAQYQGIQEKWKQEASDAAFTAKLNEFDAARKELEAFPRRRREGLQELEKNRKQIQLQKWLDRHYIRDANLAGIGAGRKALLASYGIDTAGDLSWPSLQPVNGIGPRNAATLMTWRDSVATQFVFNPGQGIGQLEIARLDRELADRRAGLEQKLTGGAGELQIIRQRIFDARASLQADAERALELLMQAEAHGKRIGFR